MADAQESTLAPDARVVVRHYCQGIGDCHLLGFPRTDGGLFWMLIDCGVHTSVKGGSAYIDDVVADVAATTKNHLDVIVITHEHTDHTSGFLTAAERFKAFSVGAVWLGWTEDPKDPQARELDKYKQQSLAALQLTSRHLDRAVGLSPHLQSLRRGLDALMSFNFGAKGDRVRASRDAAKALAKGRVCYYEPGDPPIMLENVPGLRIYVLGPPRDAKLLGTTERSSEMYQAAPGAAGWPFERALSGAFAANGIESAGDDDFLTPFDPDVGSDLSRIAASGGAAVPADIPKHVAAFARDHYFGPTLAAGPEILSRPRRYKQDPNEFDQSWRRIDLDWLAIGADLAMQLDDRTNNTSLVLAFEFIDSRRVLLFAADAQVGSWLSWQKTRWQVNGATVTGSELLERTIYYKVGHHGSHNATLKQNGLEQMTSPDLTAFIPTKAVDAQKIGWGRMPFPSILTALAERCDGRVIRADDPWVSDAGSAPEFPIPGGAIQKLDHRSGLWVEVQLA
jgi:hypothetical protein